MTGERLVGPVTLSRPDEPRLHVGRERVFPSGRAFGPRPAPGNAGRNPRFEDCHLLCQERFVGGHRRFVLAADRLQDLARCRVAGGENRSGVAPLEHRREAVEPQPPLGHPGPVTTLATSDQERPDLLLEQFFLLRRDGGGRARPGQSSHRQRQQQPRQLDPCGPEVRGTADGASAGTHGGGRGPRGRSATANSSPRPSDVRLPVAACCGSGLLPMV